MSGKGKRREGVGGAVRGLDAGGWMRGVGLEPGAWRGEVLGGGGGQALLLGWGEGGRGPGTAAAAVGGVEGEAHGLRAAGGGGGRVRGGVGRGGGARGEGGRRHSSFVIRHPSGRRRERG